MHVYFKIDPATNNIIEVKTYDQPITEYVTRDQGVVNGKPFLVEATIIDPPYDSATQIKTGPVDTYEGSPPEAKRTYVVEDIPGTNIVLTLEEEQQRAKDSIDLASEQARKRHITPGSGQAMTYMEKVDEAIDYVAANYPADLTSYPMIQAEVNATGKTPNQAADDIIAIRTAWISISAQIEEIRLKAKIDVMAATDNASVQTIADNAISQLDLI